MKIPEDKQKRSLRFYQILIALSLIIFVVMLWFLRTMIVPTIVGALLAYACIPLMRKLQKRGVPDSLALLVLLSSFFVGIFLVTEMVRDIIPDENGKLVMRVRVQYKMYEKYQTYIGENDSFIGEIFAEEIDPLFEDIVEILSLNQEEQLQFLKFYQGQRSRNPMLNTYHDYFLYNLKKKEEEQEQKNLQVLTSQDNADHQEIQKSAQTAESGGILSAISEIVSIWLIAPFVFLFLLTDKGDIKKSLMSLVPNRYFELTLTIVDSVDEAIGKYLRGTLIECSLVGLSFSVCLFLIGIEFKWALLIGVIAGLANAIPFLGPAIGLIVGVFYALIAENMQPLLPFIDPENVLLWVLISVGIVQALDNSVFQPIVLGSAVNLHPLVVIFGVMGGSTMLGMAGMLFAIPTIVVIKVFFSTLIQELKAYHLIE